MAGVNYYCVCVLKFRRRGRMEQMLDPNFTFPNPEKDPTGPAKCQQRAAALRESLGTHKGDSFRESWNIPRGVVEVKPILYREIE